MLSFYNRTGGGIDEEDRERGRTGGLSGPGEENLPSLYCQPCDRVRKCSYSIGKAYFQHVFVHRIV